MERDQVEGRAVDIELQVERGAALRRVGGHAPERERVDELGRGGC